jgi:hypothetical protein
LRTANREERTVKGSIKELIDLLAAEKRDRKKSAEQWRLIAERTAPLMRYAMTTEGVDPQKADELRFSFTANLTKLADTEERSVAYLDTVIGDLDEIRSAAVTARSRRDERAFKI